MPAAKGRTSSQGGKSAGLSARDERLSDALAQASWAEADEALAEAMVEFAELRRALTEESDALAMASQALSRAARRRGLALFGKIGAAIDFDAEVHDLGGSPASHVRIVREGVVRGREVLIRALVKPARKAVKRVRP